MTFIKLLRIAPLSAKIGIFIVALNLAAGVFAPWIAPYGESEVIGGVWESSTLWPSEDDPNAESSFRHILGTDQLGRDLLTRIIFGARNTIALAIIITALAFVGGVFAGFLAAELKGWVEQLLSRINDIIMAFPTLILALVVISIMGSSTPVLIGVLALITSTRVFRVSQALATDIAVMEYVEVARLKGEGTWYIMRSEILPNALPPLIAEFGLRFCFVFLFISALSFLGLGINPPLADWGAMVRENAAAISFGIFTPLVPAGAIALLTIGINLIVDWFLNQAAGRLNTEL